MANSPSYTPGNYPQQDSAQGNRQFFTGQLSQISAAIQQSAQTLSSIQSSLTALQTSVTALQGSVTTLQANLLPPGCGQLQFVSATQIKFVPFNGDRSKIAGTIYAIPSAGITAANTSVYVNGTAGQNLAVSTVYNVYLFNNSGTLTVDFSTTAHATDTTAGNVGVEIKSGDNTRTLIGKVRTNGSSQFVDSATSRYVASWFNRRCRQLAGATASVATASASYAELSVAARIDFVSWGDAVDAGWIGFSYNDTINAANLVSLGLDTGASASLSATESANAPANTVFPSSGFGALAPTEGYHYLTPVGFVSAGTGTFNINAYADILT